MKEFDHLVIAEVTFDAKMTSESHLPFVKTNILTFSCLSLSIVKLCGDQLPIRNLIKQLHRAVISNSFLKGGVVECSLVHRRSVAVIVDALQEQDWNPL